MAGTIHYRGQGWGPGTAACLYRSGFTPARGDALTTPDADKVTCAACLDALAGIVFSYLHHHPPVG